MTFYEELGVSQRASREELRQGYKQLVRLLHPDRCPDAATRALADLQMRRLNGILAVLTDPEQRANYDCSLAGIDRRGRRVMDCNGRRVASRPAWRWWRYTAAWWRFMLKKVATLLRRASPLRCGSPRNAQADRENPRGRPRDQAQDTASGRGTGSFATRATFEAGRWRGTYRNWWNRACRGPAFSGDPGGVFFRCGERWSEFGTLATAAAITGVIALFFCTRIPSGPPVPASAMQAETMPAQAVTRGRARTRHTRTSSAKTPAEHDPTLDTSDQDRTARLLAPPRTNPSERPPEAAFEADPVWDRDPLSHAASGPGAWTPAVSVGPGERPSEESGNRLAGDWFFVSSSDARKNGYPPEYIELRLSEKQGVLQGRYRARYRVADRAISPNVAFRFEGRTAADGGVLPWTGPGGARGEVTLKLLANGNLEVGWAAGQLGEELGLISGTATLVRRLE